MVAERHADVLVLGVGNLLLADDGVGLQLLDGLHADFADDPRVELVDGGTQGLALLGLLERRQVLLMLDAIQFGAAPGTVHARFGFDSDLAARAAGSIGAHGGNAGELLNAAHLLGVLPATVCVLGIEPARIETAIGLSPAVRAALPRALAQARGFLLHHVGADVPAEPRSCTS